ncbi:hypothetical protein [Lysobacter enzymogenes]|uniref:hypothetical protein n=1 Tax=Lysobacter enzymogenes TaxID=69 RepID=UPI003D18E6FD
MRPKSIGPEGPPTKARRPGLLLWEGPALVGGPSGPTLSAQVATHPNNENGRPRAPVSASGRSRKQPINARPAPPSGRRSAWSGRRRTPAGRAGRPPTRRRPPRPR